MFERVLVPLDRSLLAECVLPHAVAVAHALASQLILLHILSPSGRQDGLRAVDPLEWQLRRAEAESYLGGVRSRLEEVDVAAQTKVLDGDAAEQILAFASENQVGLVIISSHGQSGLSGWNVSSVVQKVIMRASISLMVVRAYQPAPHDLGGLRYRRVVVPLDTSRAPKVCCRWPPPLPALPRRRSCWRTWCSVPRCRGERRPVKRITTWPTASWSATGLRPNNTWR